MNHDPVALCEDACQSPILGACYDILSWRFVQNDDAGHKFLRDTEKLMIGRDPVFVLPFNSGASVDLLLQKLSAEHKRRRALGDNTPYDVYRYTDQ